MQFNVATVLMPTTLTDSAFHQVKIGFDIAPQRETLHCNATFLRR